MLRVRRPESVIEYVIAYAATKGDSLRFVKGPVNAEINSALTVLFLGLRQSRKAARPKGSDMSIVIAGLPIELIGNENERDVVGAVEAAHG